MEPQIKARYDKITEQKKEWNDKFRKVPGTYRSGYAHFVSTVEILEGEPSGDIIMNFADGWGWNWGGEILRRWTQDGKRFVQVKVYTD